MENMTLSLVELETNLDIALEILVNSYHNDIVSVHILSKMWNYLRLLLVNGRRALVEVLKEELHANYFSQGCKGVVNICFSSNLYVSVIERPAGKIFTVKNEVEVTNTGTRYIQRLLVT